MTKLLQSLTSKWSILPIGRVASEYKNALIAPVTLSSILWEDKFEVCPSHFLFDRESFWSPVGVPLELSDWTDKKRKSEANKKELTMDKTIAVTKFVSKKEKLKWANY